MNITMATNPLKEIQPILPYLLKHKTVCSSYDEEADVLYLHFKKSNQADDYTMTEDDVIFRYENGELVGMTILNASQWVKQKV